MTPVRERGEPAAHLPFRLPPPPQAVINTMCGQSMQARSYLEASKVIYTNGCIDKLVNWIHSNLFLLGGVALGLAIPQVPRISRVADTAAAEGQGKGSCQTTARGRRSQGKAPACSLRAFSPPSQLVGILLSQILVSQIKDQIKLQLYNQQHRADPWY